MPLVRSCSGSAGPPRPLHGVPAPAYIREVMDVKPVEPEQVDISWYSSMAKGIETAKTLRKPVLLQPLGQGLHEHDRW